MLKETICTSEKLNRLTDFEFRLWTGLLTLADDYGCGDGRAAIVRNFVFPLRDGISTARVEKALLRLAEEDCIRFYEAEGRRYFWFPNWLEHQRLRSHKPKYPQPPELQPVVAQKQQEAEQRKALKEKKGKKKPYDYEPVYERFESEEAAELAAEKAAEDAVFDALHEKLAMDFEAERQRLAVTPAVESVRRPLPSDEARMRDYCLQRGIPL